MRVLFLNNDGGGFADFVEVAPKTTIEKFIAKQLPDHPASDLLIRVNRQPVPSSYVLQDGDRVSACPTKIAGA